MKIGDAVLCWVATGFFRLWREPQFHHASVCSDRLYRLDVLITNGAHIEVRWP
jgi:hypothetical protein